MRGRFISFEGTEGSGKSTQIRRLARRLETYGRRVVLLREPGGTPIGEEIRHTLKHSPVNGAMTAEAELLLMNASRAQLVREVIEPALIAGDCVLTDRFYDSTLAYQGYGRGLDLNRVRTIVDFAVGTTKPDRTVLLFVPLSVSEARRAERERQEGVVRDRLEEAGRAFFERVEEGYKQIAQANSDRIHWIDATMDIDAVESAVWNSVRSLFE